MAYSDYLNKMMYVLKREYAQDAAGGQIERQTTQGAFMCRIENLSSSEIPHLNHNSVEVYVRVYTTPDADPVIKHLDVVRIVEKNGALVGEFQINRPQRMEQTQNLHHIELDAKLHTPVKKTKPPIPEPT
jgi:hypothetical protein